MVGVFAFSFPAVKGNADGNLKLNTDVLMNNGSSVGGSGEFPIRGQLFSNELIEKSQKLQESQAQLAKQKQVINFEEKSTQNFNTKSMTEALFQEYKPQVITTLEDSDNKSEMNLYILGIVGGLALILFGVLIGNRRIKKKWRKNRV